MLGRLPRTMKDTCAMKEEEKNFPLRMPNLSDGYKRREIL
jgi:hypothetical protein